MILRQFEWRLSVRISLLLQLVFCWCYLLMPTALPGGIATATLLALGFVFIGHRVFGSEALEFSVGRNEVICFGLFLAILLLSHGPILFMSLSNDEPHHAEAALFFLKTLANWTFADSSGSFDSLRGSFWDVIGLRGMAATEVWRIVFAGFALYIALSVWIWRKIAARSRLWADVSAVLLIALVGYFTRGWLDNHPPLRTLVPFLSAGFFGLNDFAFRFSSILSAALFLTWLTQRIAVRGDYFLAFASALLVIFLPQVFHTSGIVEPSIYGFVGWSVVLILILDALEKDNPRLLQAAAMVLPIFALTRFAAIFLIIPIGFVYLLRWKWISKRVIVQIAMSWFLVAGLLAALREIRNSAAAVNPGWEHLAAIFTDSRPLGTILRNFGWPWVAAFVIAWLGFIVYKRRFLFLSLFLPVLFTIYNFAVDENAWGIGRYQAEYMGGFFCLFVYAISSQFPSNWRTRVAVSAIGVFLISWTLEQNHRLGSDNYAKGGQATLIANSSFFAYRQATEYLKRQDVDTEFVFLGGAPATYESILWFSSYPLRESRIWLSQAYEFQRLVMARPSLELLKSYFTERKIKYLVVQSERRHERIVRVPEIQSLIEKIESHQTSPINLEFIQSYEGPWGGNLRIFKIL